MRPSTRLTIAIAIAASSSLAAAGREAGGVRAVSPNEAAPLLDDEDVVVLDIRTPPEVEQARIAEDVLHLDFHAPEFPQQLSELDRSRTYLMYCRSGQRSGNARAMMEDLGFQDVVDVRGGLIAWVDAGLDIHS